ncbi:MAG: uracil-DNA glycosylase [Geodermatophilaceae bacterium]|nr:uracil-DNA glycosylase [Geodermatophilaceae bacterium]
MDLEGPDHPAKAAPSCADLSRLDHAVSDCRACPRLVRWREEVARLKRAAYRDWTYWARPVPGFGPGDARIAIVGLAPAAHGGNRTGRVFTGDRSGDWLYAAMHRVGLADQATSVAIDDGLQLRDSRVLAAVRCAPPANKPTTAERDTCAPWMARELALLPNLGVIVVLGQFGWNALWPVLANLSYAIPRPRPRFGHGVEAVIDHPDRPSLDVLGCYHVSQQNTFTGVLTEAMLDSILTRARKLAAVDDAGAEPAEKAH